MKKHLFKVPFVMRQVNPAKPNQRHNFIITGRQRLTPDFVSNYEDIEELPQENFEEKGRHVCCHSVRQYIRVMNPSYWFFLMFLGLITAFLSFFVDYSSQELRKRKLSDAVISHLCFNQSSYLLGYFLWVLFSVCFCLLAAAVGQFISRDAEGSGIPELKSILAGVNIYKYLSFQTLIGKTIGLFCGLVSGTLLLTQASRSARKAPSCISQQASPTSCPRSSFSKR